MKGFCFLFMLLIAVCALSWCAPRAIAGDSVTVAVNSSPALVVEVPDAPRCTVCVPVAAEIKITKTTPITTAVGTVGRSAATVGKAAVAVVEKIIPDKKSTVTIQPAVQASCHRGRCGLDVKINAPGVRVRLRR